MTINEKDKRVENKRLTHNQSFPGIVSSKSIKFLVSHEELEAMIYGFMFIKMMHIIHAVQFAFPNIEILVSKYDLESVYRRLHMNVPSAATFICSTTLCALIYLRLTFVGSFSPAE